jgi:hypothetical protein
MAQMRSQNGKPSSPIRLINAAVDELTEYVAGVVATGDVALIDACADKVWDLLLSWRAAHAVRNGKAAK